MEVADEEHDQGSLVVLKQETLNCKLFLRKPPKAIASAATRLSEVEQIFASANCGVKQVHVQFDEWKSLGDQHDYRGHYSSSRKEDGRRLRCCILIF